MSCWLVFYCPGLSPAVGAAAGRCAAAAGAFPEAAGAPLLAAGPLPAPAPACVGRASPLTADLGCTGLEVSTFSGSLGLLTRARASSLQPHCKCVLQSEWKHYEKAPALFSADDAGHASPLQGVDTGCRHPL